MAFLDNIGTTELIIIGVVLLVIFGGKRMTEWARSLGETGKELKKVKKEFSSALENENDSTTSDSTSEKEKEVA